MRVYGFISQHYIKEMLPSGVQTGLGNEWVRVGAMKMVSDGSISERDCARVAALHGAAERLRNPGARPRSSFSKWHAKPHDAGWQIGTHANGDVAIDMVLRVYERLQRETPQATIRVFGSSIAP